MDKSGRGKEKLNLRRRFFKQAVSMLCTLCIILGGVNVPMTAYAATRLNESTIRDFLNNKNGSTESASAGFCLRWSFDQFKNLGAWDAKAGVSSCCAHFCGTHMSGTSTDMSNIPIGAIVFFSGPSNQGYCGTCGNHYGHAGIYVGDGCVSSIHSRGQIKTESISLWNLWGYRTLCWAVPKNVEINRDVTAPVAIPDVSDLRADNLGSDGFDVSCVVTNDANLDRVEFPTWTAYNDQDDLHWYRASKYSDGRWHYHVSVSDHNNESGVYYTHAYAFATNGEHGAVAGIATDVPQKDTAWPVVSNVKVENITVSGYDISCTVTDNVGVKKVQFCTWTTENAEDDLVRTDVTGVNGIYKLHISTADHNYESGRYVTRICAWDYQDHQTQASSGAVTVPTRVDITDLKVDRTSVVLKVGETAKITATVLPQNAYDKSISWISSNTSVAKVEDGVITAVAKGTAIIDISPVSKPRISRLCTVTVVANDKKTGTSTGTSATKKLIGTKFKKSNIKYVITAKNQVSAYGVVKKYSSVKIPATVTYKGKKYKVTAISANTFKGNKSLKYLRVGSNVKKIGKNAFYGCKKLNKIDIYSTSLTTKTVGSNAFKGIHSKACVNVKMSVYKKYKTLLKSKGLKGKKQKVYKL